MVTREIGWLDTYRGIIVALSAQSLPFTIFLFHTYYRTLPREIIDAAEVDGASFWQVAFRIVLPMSGTIMATVGILIFMSVWATYLLGLVLLRREQMYILSMMINNMEIVFRVRIPVFYAGFMLMALPMLAVAWWAQRFISTGMLAGSIKE
jgi:ABC-type glycerol-3-phosphate transport system permease component